VSIVLSRGKCRLLGENNDRSSFDSIFGARETKKRGLPTGMEEDQGQRNETRYVITKKNT
jgi:hypothetical protein